VIESLHLRNFQCWKKYDLELDPHATILVGPSDKGKTALLRGLRWLAINRPLGDSFVRHGSNGVVSVSLRVDDAAVKRSKGGDDGNVFVLNGDKIAAPGTEVPSAIAALLNLDPALNLQRQHDPPFWFSLTPSEVAKELNRVVNLELIDRTLANAAAEAKRVKAVIGVSEERLAKAKAEAERLAWVTEADAALREVESKEAALDENRDKRTRIADVLKQVKSTDERLKRLSGLKDSGEKAVVAGQDALAVAKKAETLYTAVQNIKETGEKLCDARKKQADAERELAAVKVCPACGKPR
jgi:exonuclease SbcC